MNSRILKRYKIASKRRFGELWNFAMQYPEWKAKMDNIVYLSSPNLDGMPHSGKIGDSTSTIAAQIEPYAHKIYLVDKCINETTDNPVLRNALYKGVTEGWSFKRLKDNQIIFCQRDTYYELRAKFYWLLDQNYTKNS